MKTYLYKWIYYVVFQAFSFSAFCQPESPSVVFQTGFNANLNSSFQFSPKNNYLIGFNDVGEFILWDLKSSKQVKRFMPLRNEIPKMFYSPTAVMSQSENFILIPDLNQGSYFIFDVKGNRTSHTFMPPGKDEFYTHAQISEDESKILLISQSIGKGTSCNVSVFTIKGEILKTWQVTVPPLIANRDIAFIVGKLVKIMKNLPSVSYAVASKGLDELYFSVHTGAIYKTILNMGPSGNLPEYLNAQKLTDSIKVNISDFQIYNGKLIVKAGEQLKKSGKTFIKSERILVISTTNGKIERSLTGSIAIIDEKLRSNAVGSLTTTASHSLNTYFQVKMIGEDDFELKAKDVITDKELFNYKKGQPFIWNTVGAYKSGQLNGGFLMDVSADQKLMVECSRELLVHNILSGNINNEIAPTRGNIKLNAPVFLNNTTLLVPKITNDAFIVDLKTALVSRLKDQVECNDTARSAANMAFELANDAAIGLNNIRLSDDGKQILAVNFIPDQLCGLDKNKKLEIYDSATGIKQKTFSFNDPEFTYFLNPVSDDPTSFLVNHKLIRFSDTNHYSIKELKIIIKKDTLFAVNPVFLPESKTIFTILSTRSKPGEPDLIFAHFNLEGEVTKSYRFKRKDNKLEYRSFVTESQISPDKTKLLYGMMDGTAGIFDIQKMLMASTYEHGKGLDVKIARLHQHTSIISASFIDDSHFVTAGSDGDILLWTEGKTEPDRKINTEPLIMFSLVLSPDKKYLVGAALDKTIKFIDYKTGEVKTSFVALNHETYALINDEGFYMSNKKSSNDLWFFYGGNTYEFSQFDLNLNRPDKVLKGLGYISPMHSALYLNAYKKRLQKMNNKPASYTGINTYNAPELKLTGLPENRQVTALAELKFNVIASDTDQLLDNIIINVNGVPINGIKGLKVAQSKLGEIQMPVTVPLTIGINRITVSIRNKLGSESLREFISIKRTGIPKKPDVYIISIGSGKFKEKSKNLIYPGKDANDMTALFTAGAAYNKVFPYSFVDEKVTRQNILGMKAILKKSKPEDFIVLFYAGHGIVDKDLNYFLSTYPTVFDKPALDAIAFEDLENLLDDVPSRNKIMLIDACHSGEIDKEGISAQLAENTKPTNEPAVRSGGSTYLTDSLNDSNNPFQLMKTLFADIRMNNGASIIAAAGSTQYALENHSWNNGAFTYCLKNGLKDKKADINQNGEVSVSELISYLRSNVADLTGGNQMPASRTENMVNDFIIWR